MIFITGSTGLLGSHLLHELVSEGKEIRALKRNDSSLDEVRKVFGYYDTDPGVLLSRIQWVTGSVTDVEVLEKALEGVEEIYHCAAVVSFDPKDKEQMMEVNVGGTAKLVNLATEKNIPKFCFVSSVASLGPGVEGIPLDETAYWKKTRASSWYSWSKFQSEMEVWRGIAEGLNAVIVNPSIILGPGHWHRSSGNLFRTLHRGMSFYTPGTAGYVDVRDVVKATVALMYREKFGERFILNSENLSYKEAFTIISLAFGKNSPRHKISRFFSSAAWRLDWLKSKIAPWPRVITKEMIRAGRQEKRYSSKKVCETLGMKFIPFSESIHWTVEIFLKEQK